MNTEENMMATCIRELDKLAQREADLAKARGYARICKRCSLIFYVGIVCVLLGLLLDQQLLAIIGPSIIFPAAIVRFVFEGKIRKLRGW